MSDATMRLVRDVAMVGSLVGQYAGNDAFDAWKRICTALSTPSTRDEVGPVAGEVVAWHKMAENQPEPGFKFVALYEDGSGAWLGFQHDGVVIDVDGDEYAQIPAAQWWAYLPTGFEFTCEDYSEDLFSLPAHVCPPLYAAPPPPQDDALRTAMEALSAVIIADNHRPIGGVTSADWIRNVQKPAINFASKVLAALKSTAAQEGGAK